ncbi:MAG: hypothetical protein F4029_06540 [Gammaproteobacteria bacterium]|nr:hypothetical protein [Gammaproteobacteria bacterium]MYK45869.1 hypothetical protein [Gammaproteobacteria bacterium]
MSDLLELAANRSDSWFDLWQLYFVMTSTVLLTVSATPTPVSKRTATVLCGLIGLAFFGFWTAFWSAYEARVAIASAVEAVAGGHPGQEHRGLAEEISRTLGPTWCREAWIASYSMYSLAVLGLTWYIPSRRRKAMRDC